MIKNIFFNGLFLILIVLFSSNSFSYEPSSVNKKTFELWMSEVSNWGRWGKDDKYGAINLITDEKRREAAAIVEKGIVVSLARDMNEEKTNENHSPLLHKAEILDIESSHAAVDTISINYHGITHTHLDALCHIFHKGKMYNGYLKKYVNNSGCEKLSVNNFSKGITTRGILIDIAYIKNMNWLPPGYAITSFDLDLWAKETGVNIKPGDAVLIRTGRWKRRQAIDMKGKGWVGLHASAVQWFREKDISLLGSDTQSEVRPTMVEGEPFPVHKLLITSMGVPMLDNLDLDNLRIVAEHERRWEFMINILPLRVVRGTGSPVNPIAIF